MNYCDGRSLLRWTCSAVLVCGNALQGALLRTEDTRADLRAGSSAPLLAELRGRSGLWRNHTPETLLPEEPNLHWRFNSALSHTNTQSVVFVYDCAERQLRASWEWTARIQHGPLEHSIHIQNRGKQEVWISLQDSLRFALPLNQHAALTYFFIDKGAGKPTADGTHLRELPVGSHWVGKSSTYARDGAEIIPWVAIEPGEAGVGWYTGLEFSGRTRLALNRESGLLQISVGLDPQPGPFRTRLSPGASFDTPTVLVGAYAGGLDGLGNVLRPWVRAALGNPQSWADARFPYVTNNSWGSGMQVDHSLAERMIADSADLGAEMFHLDAGWFRAVGDWFPDTRKFPQGLRAIASLAHRSGLRFGLWADWSQAGVSRAPGALNVDAPVVRGWLVSDLPFGWKPEEFKGQTIDIGVHEAQLYAQHETDRIVRDYDLDMLEHDGYVVTQGCIRSDHPHAPSDTARLSILHESGNYIVQSSSSTDVSLHAVRAYYAIQSELRREHPRLLLEICNDGGRMVDFGSAAHGDYFSITDSYDPLSNRQAFYDASHLLPAAMLETYVQKWPTPTIENFRYMLRSGMLGWFTIMQDTSVWTAEQRAIAKAEIQLYKERLRPLIRDAALYHVGPRPDGQGWDGVEYFDEDHLKGVLYAFRGAAPGRDRHRFALHRVASDRRYRLHFQDGSATDRVIAGSELLHSGIEVSRSTPLSAELVFFEEAR